MIKLLELLNEVEEYDVENEQDIKEFVAFYYHNALIYLGNIS